LLRKPVTIHSRWHEDAQTIISWRPNPNILRKIICISEHQRHFFPPGDILNLQMLIVMRNPYKTQTEWNSEILLPDTSGPARFVCPARVHPHKGQYLLL